MAQWEEHHLTDRIIEILRDVPEDTTYQTGRVFITTYQLAIEFERRFPDLFRELALSVGGLGEGVYALTSYFGRWLTDRVRHHHAREIEFVVMGSQHITILEFEGRVTATTIGPNQALPIFRFVGG